GGAADKGGVGGVAGGDDVLDLDRAAHAEGDHVEQASRLTAVGRFQDACLRGQAVDGVTYELQRNPPWGWWGGAAPVRAAAGQAAVQPPSRAKAAPVTKAASSLAR